MKKVYFLFILIACSQNSFSQKNNVLKLGVTSLIGKHINVQYERVITPYASFGLGVRYRPDSKIGESEGYFYSVFGPDYNLTSNVNFNYYNYSSVALSPEFRFYLAGEAPQQFYIAGYSRLRQSKIEGTIGGLANDGNDYTANLNALITGVSVGANLYVNDNVSIDWLMLGIHRSWLHLKSVWNSPDELTIDQQNDFKDEFDRLDEITIMKFDNEVTKNGYTIDSRFRNIGVRMGLNICYSF